MQPAFPGMPQMPMGPGAPSDVGPDGGLVDPGMIGPDGAPMDDGGDPPGEDAEPGGPQDEPPAGDGDFPPEGGGGDSDDNGSEPSKKGGPGKSKKKSSLRGAAVRRYSGLEGQLLTEDQLLRHVAIRVSGADPRVLAAMRRQSARGRRPFSRRVMARGERFVYHGNSVRLPPEVHAVVHDDSLPEHVRGFHLARHLLTRDLGGDREIAHSGEQLGQDWHRDSYYASQEAKASHGGVAPGRTPYVIQALEPEPQHVLADDNRKGYPLWQHAGSPVHFTGLYWHHPESQIPGSPHEGKEGFLAFPEPITARA